MGGEEDCSRASSASARGLPPRGRGRGPTFAHLGEQVGITPAWAGKRECLQLAHESPQGLPPRGRGRGAQPCRRRSGGGITPAWAGKRQVKQQRGSGFKDYPRVGGEEFGLQSRAEVLDGLPPRGRGRGWHLHGDDLAHRITPAWAGKSFPLARLVTLGRDYPRVGGEELAWTRPEQYYWGLPPRGRGRGIDAGEVVSVDGITPAWAGKSHTAA